MTGEDLYIEEPCSQCGQKKLKNASFCPHCGYVKKKGWSEGFREIFGRGEVGEGTGGLKGPTVSMVIGILFAMYLVYSAIEKNSIQSLIMAVLVLFAVLQSWLSGRKKRENADREEDNDRERESDPLENEVRCENCGTRVDTEAQVCPKCGMKFG